MAGFTTSSTIGVDFNNAGSTQLFTLGTKVLGSDNSEWEYVLASGSITTGQFVQVIGSGTAGVLLTSNLVYNSLALDIGVAQYTISAASYGWVAKRGRRLYALIQGSAVPGGNAWSFATGGAITTSLAAAVGLTAAGVFLAGVSAVPAVAGDTVVVQGLTMVWPRSLTAALPA